MFVNRDDDDDETGGIHKQAQVKADSRRKEEAKCGIICISYIP